jgi:hypothetical protein
MTPRLVSENVVVNVGVHLLLMLFQMGRRNLNLLYVTYQEETLFKDIEFRILDT